MSIDGNNDITYLNDQPRQENELRKSTNVPRMVEASVEEAFFEGDIYKVRVRSLGRDIPGPTSRKIALRETVESHYISGPPQVGDRVMIIAPLGTADAYAVRMDQPKYRDAGYYNFNYRNVAKGLF